MLPLPSTVHLTHSSSRLPFPSAFSVLLRSCIVDSAFLRLGCRILLPVNQRSLATSFCDVVAEKYSLSELPDFDAEEEEQCCDDDNGPFPCDCLVFEDDAVDNGNVERRDEADETEEDGPEKEFVAANIVEPKVDEVSATS